MEATCKHCGERLSDGAMICPKCKVADPLGKVKDEAEHFREELVEGAGKPSNIGTYLKETCKHCGEEIPEGAKICPKCKAADPLCRVTDQAERFLEEQVEGAGKPSKK